MEQETTVKLKQPKGLWLLSFTSIWERFSYYGMRAILVLYVANAAFDSHNPKAHLGGLGLSENNAGWIYSSFTSMCYLLPLLGGFFADRYFGKRRSVLIGGFLIMIGHFTLAADLGFFPFIAGLTVLAFGNGFFKPSAPSMIGDLYEQGDKRRDSGFTIYYTLFNGGAFFAPLICGFFGETYAYRYGFLTAGFAMMFGLIVYMIFAKKYLGDIGMRPIHAVNKEAKVVKAPLTKEEKDRISVIFVLLFFVTFFWSGFEQAGSTFTLYTDKYLSKTIGGWEMPTSWLQAVNPVFIVILGPLFSMLWVWLAKKKKNPPTPIKMGIGMVALAVGFLFMIGAVLQRGGNVQDTAVKASIFWMIATYFFHTIGELCLSPIGLSMVTKLAPLRLASMFMGIWFLGSAAANYTSGLMIIFANAYGYFALFTMFAILVGVLSIVVFLASNKLLTLMHGRD
jgi:POT family proton-dependent oligopeptide transporter